MKYFLTEVNNLEFDSEPQYQNIQNKITETLSTLGHSKSSVDNFHIFNSKSKNSTATKESANTSLDTSDVSTKKVDPKPKSKKREIKVASSCDIEIDSNNDVQKKNPKGRSYFIVNINKFNRVARLSFNALHTSLT